MISDKDFSIINYMLPNDKIKVYYTKQTIANSIELSVKIKQDDGSWNNGFLYLTKNNENNVFPTIIYIPKKTEYKVLNLIEIQNEKLKEIAYLYSKMDVNNIAYYIRTKNQFNKFNLKT